MMQKLLMLSWWFYPLNITASHRPAGFAKYLPRFGWKPVVLCGEWTPATCGYWGPHFHDPNLTSCDPCEVVRVPWELHEYPKPPADSLRSLTRLLRFRISSPATRPRPIFRRLVEAGTSLMRAEQFDAIWATSPDFLTLGVAASLSKRFGVPWIADLADIPDQFCLRADGVVPWLWKSLKRWRWRQAEKGACKTAQALITASDPMVEKLRSRHTQPIFALSNGFDPDLFQNNVAQERRPFTLVYCGVLYLEHRRADILFDALDALVTQADPVATDLTVRFFTSKAENLFQMIGGRPCAKMVEINSWVAHRESIRVQQEASALLFLPHTEDKGIITSKLMEYLGTERPILSIGGDNDVTDAVISETGTGRIARSVEDTIIILREWHREWKQTGTVAFRGDRKKIEQYSWPSRAGQLAEILDQVCSQGT